MLGNVFYTFAFFHVMAARSANVLRRLRHKSPYTSECYRITFFTACVSDRHAFRTAYTELCNNCFCIYKYTVFCGQSQYFVSFFNLFWLDYPRLASPHCAQLHDNVRKLQIGKRFFGSHVDAYYTMRSLFFYGYCPTYKISH